MHTYTRLCHFSRNYFLTTSRWRPPRSGFFPVGESLNIINSIQFNSNGSWMWPCASRHAWYPEFNGSHFGLPPSSIKRMTGVHVGGKMVWTMTSRCAQAPFWEIKTWVKYQNMCSHRCIIWHALIHSHTHMRQHTHTHTFSVNMASQSTHPFLPRPLILCFIEVIRTAWTP